MPSDWIFACYLRASVIASFVMSPACSNLVALEELIEDGKRIALPTLASFCDKRFPLCKITDGEYDGSIASSGWKPILVVVHIGSKDLRNSAEISRVPDV